MPYDPIRTIKKRTSFTLSNALRFKKSYDQAVINMKSLTDDKDVIILQSSTPELSTTTMRQRAAEGLRYMIDNYNDIPEIYRGFSVEDYAMLRGMVRFNVHPDGVIIRFPGSRIALHKNAIEVIEDKSWRSKLTDFISDKSKSFIKLDGLNLSEEDITYVKNFFADLPFELRVEKSLIYVMK